MSFYQNQRKTHSGRFGPTLEKAIDIAITDDSIGMANEDTTINSLNQRKPKTERTPKQKN